jgi:hypothetical protein
VYTFAHRVDLPLFDVAVNSFASDRLDSGRMDRASACDTGYAAVMFVMFRDL